MLSRLRRAGYSRVMNRPVECLAREVPLKVGHHGLVQLAVDLSVVDLSVEGSSVSVPTFLQSLGAMVAGDGQHTRVWTLLLVEPLSKLLFDGSLKELVLRARWYGARDVFPNWPPAEWAARVSQQQSYVPTPSRISVASLGGLVSDLRRWFALLPGEAGDGEDGPGTEQQLVERRAAGGN